MGVVDRRFFAIFVVIYLAILLQGFNLQTLSRWHLVVCIVYLILPAQFVSESPIAIFTNTLSITVAIGVTMIVIQTPSLLTDAIDEYGAAAVWIVHILMHYVPVVVNITYLRVILWPEFVCYTRLTPTWQPWAAFLASVSFGLFYTLEQDPVNTYDSPLALQTLVALMAVIFSVSELCLLCVLVVFAMSDRRLSSQTTLSIDRFLCLSCSTPAQASSAPSEK